jgi:tagatose 6-phosphate kinase
MILTVTLNAAVDFTVFGGPFRVHTTNRGSDLPPDPGGKGNNVARIARLLGADVSATGFLGGFTGDFIRESLVDEGIECVFFFVDGLTRITVAYLEEGTGEETKIVPSGPRIDGGALDEFVIFFQKLLTTRRPSVVVLSGSLPVEVPGDYYGRLIDAAHMENIPVILDTSGAALSTSLTHHPDLIKPNRDEAAALTGKTTDADIIGELKRLTDMVPVVALSLGGDGAVFITREETVAVTPPPGAAVNPVGAGDAFVAGLAASFDVTGRWDRTAFSCAVAAGTACARSRELLWHDDRIEDIIAKIEIQVR